MTRGAIALIAAVLLILAVFVGIRFIQQANDYERDAVAARVFIYCLAAYREAGVSSDACSGWEKQVMESRYATLLACHRRSPELNAPFAACLDAEGVLAGLR